MDTSHARPSVIFLSPIGTFSRKPPIIVSEKKLGRQRISSDGTLRYVSEWGVLFDKRSLFPNLMRFMRRSRSGLLLSIIEVYHLLPNHYRISRITNFKCRYLSLLMMFHKRLLKERTKSC